MTPRIGIAALLMLIVFYLAISASHAQFVSGGLFNNGQATTSPTPPPPSYVGPGDIVASASAWWSADSCYATIFSGPIADVVDTATGLIGTRLQCASGGVVSALVSGSACTFVAGNACSPFATTCGAGPTYTCSVIKLYDQSGASNCSGPCDLAQTTIVNAPTLVASVVGTATCLLFNSAIPQDIQSASLSSTINQPAFTIPAVVERTSGFTNYGTWFESSPVFARFFGGTNTVQAGDGASNSVTASDSNPHAVQVVFDSTAFSATSFMQVDSTLTSSVAFAGNAMGGSAIVIGSGPGADLTGYVCEEGIWPVAFTTTPTTGQLDMMNANMHSRNGF